MIKTQMGIPLELLTAACHIAPASRFKLKGKPTPSSGIARAIPMMIEMLGETLLRGAEE
jgi:hypothetical protein